MSHKNRPSEEKVQKKIAQIESEINEGKVRSALLRAEGLVQIVPFDECVRSIVAKAYYAAGEFKTAGKHWVLSNDTSAQGQECKERFLKFSENEPKIIFESFHFRELPFGKFKSEEVNEYLENLRGTLTKEGYWFEYLAKKDKTLKDILLTFKELGPFDRHLFVAVVRVFTPIVVVTGIVLFVLYAATLQVIAWIG